MRCLLFSFLLFCFVSAPLNGQDITVRLGEVSGQPGEVVGVPVYLTYDKPLLSAFLTLTFDPDVLEPQAYSVEGTAASEVDQYLLFLEVDSNACIFGIGRRETGGLVISTIPSGSDVHIGNIMVRICSDAELDTSSIVPVPIVDTTMFNFPAVVHLGNTNRDYESKKPSRYIGGTITVKPPVGPRPVGNVQCTQLLDRIMLSYTLTESYDTIDISKNGSLIATVQGSQVEYVDTIKDTGNTIYSIVAYKDEIPSIPASCELIVVPPVAPAVTDLQYDENGLKWKIPMIVDRILVLRDGEQIAALSGDRTSYNDPDSGDKVVVYTVITELEGYQSPKVNCTANGMWMCEIGDVHVPVDASVVKLPVYASTLEPVEGFSLALSLVDPHFKLIEDPALTIENTVLYQDPDFIVINYNPLGGLPTLTVLFTMVPSSLDEYNSRLIKSGLRQNIANFYFECVGPFSPGDVYNVFIKDLVFTVVAPNAVSKNAEVLVPGEIHFGESSTLPVENLKATFSQTPDVKSGDTNVLLSWRNPGQYDLLRVKRNGELIAELPGIATQYEDAGVAAGLHIYKVVSVTDGISSFPANIFLNTITVPSAFLRCDSNRDGRIDLADPIFTLDFLFNDKEARCKDAMDANDDGKLDLSDPIFTLTYLFQGALVVPSPGVRYPWFDPTEDSLTCKE